MLLMPLAHAEIYAYRDPQGVVHLTNRTTDRRYRVVLRESPVRATPARNWVLDAPRARMNHADGEPSVRQMVRDAAFRYDVDAALLHAMVKVESNYDANAVSRAGAVGLMQLMPATAQRFGVHDSRDPESNLDGGARYIKYLMERYGSLTLALAAYNGGEAAVERYGYRIPPYKETQDYVSRVLQFYRQPR